MAIVIHSTEELAVTSGIKVMVYARSGIGKTMLCATAPGPIVLSAESGLLSLSRKNIIRQFGADTPGITYNLPVLKVETVADLTEYHKWFTSSAEAAQFETICIDSLTEIAEVILANAKPQVKDARQAYGEMLDKTMMTLRSFRDLSHKNVYFSAKEEFVKNEVTGVRTYQPMMPGQKLGPASPYIVDEVFNLNIGRTTDGTEYRYLLTQPNMQYDAKDRSGALDIMEMPNLTHIFNKIKA